MSPPSSLRRKNLAKSEELPGPKPVDFELPSPFLKSQRQGLEPRPRKKSRQTKT